MYFISFYFILNGRTIITGVVHKFTTYKTFACFEWPPVRITLHRVCEGMKEEVICPHAMWVETFVLEEEEGESVNGVSAHRPLTAHLSVMLLQYKQNMSWCYQYMFQSILKEMNKENVAAATIS